jgi:hypothetical protein
LHACAGEHREFVNDFSSCAATSKAFQVKTQHCEYKAVAEKPTPRRRSTWTVDGTKTHNLAR